jgi:hypothetical protein
MLPTNVPPTTTQLGPGAGTQALDRHDASGGNGSFTL